MSALPQGGVPCARATLMAVLGLRGGDPRGRGRCLPHKFSRDRAAIRPLHPLPSRRAVLLDMGPPGLKAEGLESRADDGDGEGMKVDLAQLEPKLLDKKANIERIEKTDAR